MNVSVFGLGYVGCVTAACLARNGHYVFGVDVNLDKVDMINDGRAPIVEPALDDLIRTVVAAGRLRATPDGTAAVKATDLALICVGTPGHGHGQPSFDAIARVGEHIGRSLVGRRQPFTVVLRSTALPGTTESVLLAAIQRTLGEDGPEVYVGCNPEFMREGASIHDFDHPPFVLIGAEDPKVTGQLREMYAGVDGEIVRTSIRSAELVKYASNAFHGLKVCFANEMGDMADALGADAREVMRIFALDRKLNISPAYLKPGFAFGGSCLPKDVRGLLWAGRMQDVDTPVLSAILPSNERQIREAVDRVLAFGRRRISVIGLAFKPDTDDLRESPMVTLVEALIGKGLDVRVFDRSVALARLVGANRRYIEHEIPHIASILTDRLDEVVAHGEVVVVGSPSDDARQVVERLSGTQDIVDLTRTYVTDRVRTRPAEVAAWT